MESPGFSQTPQPLHGMFTAVPPRYDLINRIITLGLDKRWRRLAARACLEDKPRRVLDLGCGTGDLTINIALLGGANVALTGLDYSQPMLELARRKANNAGIGERVQFIHGEATHLPFPDGHFDGVGISFAFRNLTYKNPLGPAHLAEVKRVLKSGGRYVIVESSQPANLVIRTIFHFYLRVFVAPVGILLSGNKSAYRYLAESTAHFYSPQEVKDMLLAAGFRDISYRPLFFGAAGIHVATK
jgi:demethylmenaquinone methyltransferase / 2-methoxy-6-polyprenyl-1,4-benzoquinol methylase